MAPESSNNNEAQWYQTTPEEVDILKDPSKFDEAALRKMYIGRLDKASGNKMLRGAELTKYLEAKQKIEQNIKDLRELRDYAVNRVKLLDSAKLVKDIGKIDGPVKYVLAMFAYRDLNNQLNNPPKVFHAMLDFTQKDQKEFKKIRQSFSMMLDEYYLYEVGKGGEKELNKVKSITTPGNLRLVDYMDLENEIETIQELVDDNFPGGGPALKDMAIKRIKMMQGVLKASVAMLGKDDKFAVENYGRATAAKKRGDKNADQWWNGSLQYLAMRYSHQDADRKKTEALALGSDGGVYNTADKLYEQAAQKEKSKDYAGADKLYMAARDRFQQSREIYVAQQAKKKSTKKLA